MQAQVHEQSRKRDETVHTIDVVQREREHAADNERLKMQGKIAEIAEEVSRKILSKEIRLREEAQQKFGNIEKVRIGNQSLYWITGLKPVISVLSGLHVFFNGRLFENSATRGQQTYQVRVHNSYSKQW